MAVEAGVVVASVRREVIYASTGSVVVAVGLLRWEISFTPLVLVIGLVAAVVASVVDLKERRLPNRVVLPASAAVFVFIAAAALGGEPARSVVALAAGVVAFLAYGAVWWLRPTALGYGDVKLAGLLGLVTGWVGVSVALAAVVLAFCGAAVVAIALLVVGRSRNSELPFGPFMSAGALAAVTLHLLGSLG